MFCLFTQAEFTAQASTLRAEIDAERDRTRDVQERAAKELNAVIEREKATIIELRANHSFAMDRLKETKNAELAAAESKSLSTLSETNAKHAADTARMLDTHETALSDLKNSHEKALWDHTVDAETKLESVIDEWQSRHKDDTARLVAERWKQLCDLKESLGKDHSAALLERQAQWDAREEELTAMFTSAVAEAESLTEKLENAERNRDAFRMELEKLRETLEATEDAARENAERMAFERAEAESAIRGDHELTLASLESDRINETESLKREMEQRTKQADEAYADLLGWYEDVKRRFESRESRSEDLATIEHLSKVCSDKENEASEWRGHSEQMRLTLKNREGTFTQAAFGNGAATLKADAVFLSPPWGGPDYGDDFDVAAIRVGGVDGVGLLALALAAAPRVAYYLPRTTSAAAIAAAAARAGAARGGIRVEAHYLNHRLKAKTAYVGWPADHAWPKNGKT